MFWEYCLKSDSRQIATLTLIIGSKHSHPSHHLGFGLGCDCLRFETADLLIICLVIIISYTRMTKGFDSFDKLTTVTCTNHPLQFLDAKSRRDTRVWILDILLSFKCLAFCSMPSHGHVFLAACSADMNCDGFMRWSGLLFLCLSRCLRWFMLCGLLLFQHHSSPFLAIKERPLEELLELASLPPVTWRSHGCPRLALLIATGNATNIYQNNKDCGFHGLHPLHLELHSTYSTNTISPLPQWLHKSWYTCALQATLISSSSNHTEMSWRLWKAYSWKADSQCPAVKMSHVQLSRQNHGKFQESLEVADTISSGRGPIRITQICCDSSTPSTITLIEH